MVSLRRISQKTSCFLTEIEYEARKKLKILSIQPPVLAFLNLRKNFMDTDASSSLAWCVLLQEQSDDAARLIRNGSRTLSDSEKKLAATHKERLAVVSAVFSVRPYLEGS